MSGNQNISEIDLLRGCIDGDRRMQAALYEKYAPKMYGVCLRYTDNADEAQDVLQEGFIKVYSKIHSFRSEGSLEGWIRRIFVNTAIEHYRRKKTVQPVTEKEENVLEGNYVSALDQLGEKDILALVNQISPGYKTVFNLYAVEGFSHKEIAEMLGISEGTSKSQFSRAKIILQDLVKKYLAQREKV